MRVEIHEVEWLDPPRTVTPSELGGMCSLSVAEVQELVDYGLLRPVGGAAEPVFSAECVGPLRQAATLRARFDLDVFMLGLVFSQLERIARLEREVRSLQAHLPNPPPGREGPAAWREPHDGEPPAHPSSRRTS